MRKRIVVLLFLAMFVFTVVGCGKTDENATTEAVNTNEQASTNDGATAPQEKYTIAVAWNSIDATTQTRMKYLEEYLGPELGINFIFSEAISDMDGLITFLENAYSAGADGILSNISDGEQLIAKANELGVYSAIVSSTYYEDLAELPTNMGITGIDVSRVAGAYGEILNKQFSNDNPANFIIVSGGSAMGVASHREATQSMLMTLKEKYGLTYDMDVAELVRINSITEIATNNSDVKITIVPGFPNMDGYVSGVSSLLQSGEYDAIISVYPTTEVFSTAIDEVEKALGKNIKVICQANFGENTKLAFETLDSTGNPTLDGAVMYAATANDAYGIALLYNGISGNSDVVKPEGKAIKLAPGPLVCASADEYKKLSLLDSSDDLYIYSADEVKDMIKAFNPSATYESIMQYAKDFSTEDILKRKGIE